MPTTPLTEPASPGHRPALDGIRTIAVYLVVAFHAGSGLVGGGFIGVDVFFVLSGYLVTQVLLRDLDGPDGEPGRIAFARFYSRRVRRLLPAAVLTIAVTAAVYGAVAARGALPAAVDSMRASLLYVANWHFIGEATDYFAPAEPSPVLHFWSLAVEEQFYVAWPLLLTGLWWLAGRRNAPPAARRKWVAAAVLVAGVASFAGAMALRSSAPTRAYFGTDTRAYQLLAGAFLALLPQLVSRLRERRHAWLLAPGGLLAIAASAGVVDQGPFERSAVTTVATVALILGVEAHEGSVVARGLSLRPVTYLGTISYSTYLWHWPVIVVIGELGLATSATTLAALTALIATAIAALSSELLELPIRRSPRLERRRLWVIAGGVAASVLTAALVVPPLLDLDRPRTTAWSAGGTAVEGGIPVPDSFVHADTFSDRFGEEVDCTSASAAACTVVDGDGLHILLVGDSNAVMYVPAFTELARAEGLRLSAAAIDGCPWQLGFVHLTDELQERCRATRPDTYQRLVPELDPDVIVLVNTRIQAGSGPAPATEVAQQLLEATDRSLDQLEATGAVIVLVPSMPLPPGRFNPLECLRDATTIDQCSFESTPQQSWLDGELAARAAASEQVHLVDWRRMVCPRLPRCDAMLGEVPVFWNAEHITRAFSVGLAMPIGRDLAALGIIPPLSSAGG